MSELAAGWIQIGLLFAATIGVMMALCWFGLWKLSVDHQVKKLMKAIIDVEKLGGEAGAIAAAALKEIREEYA